MTQEYCCEDFKTLLDNYVIDDNNQCVDKTRFPKERFSIREDVDLEEYGAVYIRYCPRCGKKLK